MMEGSDLHPKDHSIQLFTAASNEGWGAHLEQSSTQGLWSPQEKGLHINVLELKAVFLALRHFKDQCQDQTVLVGQQQLNCGSLHKQTRGNTLGGDVRTPVETHDLVPPLSHNLESQAHSRVPECDGRPTFQVEPGAVDRMVTTSTGVQRRQDPASCAGPEVLSGPNQGPKRFPVPPFHFLQERTFLRHQTRYSLVLVETNHPTLL